MPTIIVVPPTDQEVIEFVSGKRHAETEIKRLQGIVDKVTAICKDYKEGEFAGANRAIDDVRSAVGLR